jgi:hypothetical protein
VALEVKFKLMKFLDTVEHGTTRGQYNSVSIIHHFSLDRSQIQTTHFLSLYKNFIKALRQHLNLTAVETFSKSGSSAMCGLDFLLITNTKFSFIGNLSSFIFLSKMAIF